MYLTSVHIVTLQAGPCQFPISFNAQILFIETEILALVSKSDQNSILKYHTKAQRALIKQPGSVQQPENQSNLRSIDYVSNLALPQEAKM